VIPYIVVGMERAVSETDVVRCVVRSEQEKRGSFQWVCEKSRGRERRKSGICSQKM